MGRVAKLSPQVNTGYCRFTCGVFVITLPSPDFGNVERFEYKRINRRSRGGDLIINRQSYWPKTKVFVLSWSSLDRVARSKLIRFIKDTLGKKMTFLSHESESKVGVIRTPEIELKEDGRNLHSTQIEFETED